MTESQLQSACLKLLRAELRGAVILKHSDHFTSGVPDVSITWNGKTSWWEFKAGPKMKWANGLQELTCRRLAVAGLCRVAYYGTDATFVGTPDNPTQFRAEGIDHRFVLGYVRRLHA